MIIKIYLQSCAIVHDTDKNVKAKTMLHINYQVIDNQRLYTHFKDSAQKEQVSRETNFFSVLYIYIYIYIYIYMNCKIFMWLFN